MTKSMLSLALPIRKKAFIVYDKTLLVTSTVYMYGSVHLFQILSSYKFYKKTMYLYSKPALTSMIAFAQKGLLAITP